MDKSEITKYLDIAGRRRYWLIIPFLATLLGGLGYALHAPKVYEAQTLILVQSQSVPQELVRSIVSEGIDERLRTITQQVTSRTNLETIIREYRLADEIGLSLGIDSIVDAVRKKIKIDVSKDRGRRDTTSAFTISYRGEDPKKVMQVTNALASNFISENLEIRESQVLGTSAFLADEIDSVRKRLADKEEDLKAYRERFMGGLPDQLATNLAVLQRLQSQVDQLSKSLGDAENRKILIRQTVEEARKGGQALVTPSAQGPEVKDVATLKNELAALETRYTGDHPDVVRLKRMIETKEASELKAGAGSPESLTPISRAEGSLVQQLRDIDLYIASIKAETKKVQDAIAVYQKRVEDTPKREQELFSIERDYNNLKELYQSLQKRKLEADISVSMEKKQKGEQFRIIDPAKIPTYPVEPDMKRVLLIVLALGFGLGVSLAYFVEIMDSSYRKPEEVEEDLKVPVLMSIPVRYSIQEVRRRKRIEFFKAASVSAAFVVSAAGILLATKGVSKTIEFVHSLLERI